MKYVIYKRGGLYLPVTFPDHITHSQVKIEWGDEIYIHSAGFYRLDTLGFPVVLPEISESLKIGPSEIDEEILRKFVFNCGTSAFIDYNDY